MAVLPTSPVDFGVLMDLLAFIGLIVAISHQIAYYEILFYRSSPANDGVAEVFRAA
jgi:hypothetical protein